MSKQHFLPKADLERQKWLQNISTKLGIYAGKYNVLPDEVADTVAGSAFFDYLMNNRNQVNEFATKLTAYKNESMNGVPAGADASIFPAFPVFEPAPATVEPGIFKRALAIAKRIKDNKNYTIADGNDLGLEGSIITLNPEEQKPVIKLRLIAGGHPEVVWTKQGMDAIEIYVDRGTGTFEFLAVDSYPNYTDTAPLPAAGSSAIWKYKSIYRYGDVQAGLWSDVVSITVTGV